MDVWGERTRLACGFGRRARNIVGQISWLTGFRRDAENGDRDGRAPHSQIVAADVNRLIILRAVFGWSGLTSAATAKSRRSAAVPGRSKGRTAMRLG